MRVLVTRPEPVAAVTAARLRSLGHHVDVAPLLVPRALDWQVPLPLPQAVVFTSATAARLAGPRAAALVHLPAFAVGAATADAARAVGFSAVESLGGTAAALFAAVAARGFTDVVHLAGAVRSDAALPAGLQVRACVVYAAVVASELPDAARPALAAEALTLLYSPRTAGQFARLVDAAGQRRAALPIAAISAATAAAAGTGWLRVVVAAQPTEAALFAAAGLDRLRGDGDTAGGPR